LGDTYQYFIFHFHHSPLEILSSTKVQVPYPRRQQILTQLYDNKKIAKNQLKWSTIP